MKRMTGMLLSLLLILSGCGGPRQQNETAPPQDENDPSQAKIEPIGLADNLALGASQEVELYDYDENLLVIGVFDKAKVDPTGNAINDARYPYLEKFILFDVDSQTVKDEFMVNKFAFCLSAVYAFDGVFSALAVSSGPNEGGCNFYHADAQGTRQVLAGGFTPFDDHLQLIRTEGGVVYHYDSPYTSREDHVFGVKKITADWQEETLLTFAETEYECLWTDLQACPEQYAFMVKQNQQISCYLGSATQEPIPILTLPQGVELLDFAITADMLLILQNTEADGGYYLEMYDHQGNAIDRYQIEEPCWSLTANANGQFCGVPEQVILTNTPVMLFEMSGEIRPVSVDAARIDSNWNAIFSNGKDFLIYSLYEPHQVWRLSLPAESAVG